MVSHAGSNARPETLQLVGNLVNSVRNGAVSAPVPTPHVAEIVHMQEQLRIMDSMGLRQVAVELEDAEYSRRVLVLLKAENLADMMDSYSRIMATLAGMEMPGYEISSDDAMGTFIDRLSEFMDASSRGTVGTTIVNCPRDGATVMYSKGYFLSTGAAFGMSTPARRTIAAGRYSFGILDKGVARYAKTVWPCPAVLSLDLS